MVDDAREQEIRAIIKRLEELWLMYPEQRLGQLIENYVIPSGKMRGGATCWIFHAQDEDTLMHIEDAITEVEIATAKDLRRKGYDVPIPSRRRKGVK